MYRVFQDLRYVLQDLIAGIIPNQKYLTDTVRFASNFFQQINTQDVSGLSANIAGSDFRGNTEPELS